MMNRLFGGKQDSLPVHGNISKNNGIQGIPTIYRPVS